MLSILPFNPFTFNPVTFSVQFVQAIVQGVQDALNGGASMLAPNTVPTPKSRLCSPSRGSPRHRFRTTRRRR